MSVGLLLVTHQRIGEEILAAALSILSVQPLPAATLGVSLEVDTPRLLAEGERLLAEVDSGEGVLILTDAYGSSPCNIAARMGSGRDTEVVAGLNLPMLLRVLNYPDLNLAELTEKAVSGGSDGVLRVSGADPFPDEEDAPLA